MSYKGLGDVIMWWIYNNPSVKETRPAFLKLRRDAGGNVNLIDSMQGFHNETIIRREIQLLSNLGSLKRFNVQIKIYWCWDPDALTVLSAVGLYSKRYFKFVFTHKVKSWQPLQVLIPDKHSRATYSCKMFAKGESVNCITATQCNQAKVQSQFCHQQTVRVFHKLLLISWNLRRITALAITTISRKYPAAWRKMPFWCQGSEVTLVGDPREAIGTQTTVGYNQLQPNRSSFGEVCEYIHWLATSLSTCC